jgi:uncharacterized protein (TIGR02246 family)
MLLKKLINFNLDCNSVMLKTLIGCFVPLIVFLMIIVGKIDPGIATTEIVQRQALAWQTGNVSAIISDFTPNGVFIAGNYTFRGVAEIQKAAEDYFKGFTDTKVEIKRVIVDNLQGAVEWDWSDRNKKTNQVSYAEDAIIYQLNENGKIIYWREYIEKKS